MSTPVLRLEILSGPLDGHVVELKAETFWEKGGQGALSFPWDTELGTPQARFFLEGDYWWLESLNVACKTHCLRREGRLEGKIQLERGDLLIASKTWLLADAVEEYP